MSNDILVDCFEEAVSACSLQEYSCEEELQWFLAYLLKKATRMEIKREVLTQTIYFTNERGLLEKANDQVKGRRRRRGSVDIACRGGSENWAIEIKYPSGKEQELHYCKGLRRDAQKLRDLDGYTRRYMLALVKKEHEDAFSKELASCKGDGCLKDLISIVRYI